MLQRRPTFPATCLSPDQPGYGQIVKPGLGKRRTRRPAQPDGPVHSSQEWTVVSSAESATHGRNPIASTHSAVYALHGSKPAEHSLRSENPETSTYYGPHMQNGSPVMLHVPYVERHCPSSPSTSPSDCYGSGGHRKTSPSAESTIRYNPYPSPLSSTGLRTSSLTTHRLDMIELAAPVRSYAADEPVKTETIVLPPIIPPHKKVVKECALPPISALDDMYGRQCDDSRAVLRRLQLEDSSDNFMAVDSSPTRGAHSILYQRSQEL